VTKLSTKFCQCWAFVTELSVDTGNTTPLRKAILLQQNGLSAPPVSQSKASFWHGGCFPGH